MHSFLFMLALAARPPTAAEQKQLETCAKPPCLFKLRQKAQESFAVKSLPHATRFDADGFSLEVPEGWSVSADHLPAAGDSLDVINAGSTAGCPVGPACLNLSSATAPANAIDPTKDSVIQMSGTKTTLKAGDLTFVVWDSMQDSKNQPRRQWFGQALRGKIVYSLLAFAGPQDEARMQAVLATIRVAAPAKK